jgi:hypothetical protein
MTMWGRLKTHLRAHSHDHPYYSLWMSTANGQEHNRKTLQHFKKLRPIISEREIFTYSTELSNTGRRQRKKGKLIVFGPPLPGAERNVYRLDEEHV